MRWYQNYLLAKKLPIKDFLLVCFQLLCPRLLLLLILISISLLVLQPIFSWNQFTWGDELVVMEQSVGIPLCTFLDRYDGFSNCACSCQPALKTYSNSRPHLVSGKGQRSYTIMYWSVLIINVTEMYHCLFFWIKNKIKEEKWGKKSRFHGTCFLLITSCHLSFCACLSIYTKEQN